MSLQLVWFKRDFRTFDHEALHRACAAGPVLCLYVIEPAYWELGSSSNRQWAFVRESLQDLGAQLALLGGGLVVRHGSVIDVLGALRREHGPFVLHSHEETGNGWTYDRDRAVARWCRGAGCEWHEYAQNGVRRPARAAREPFAAYWARFMEMPLFPQPRAARFVVAASSLALAQLPERLAPDPDPCPGRQSGGRAEGLAVLEAFLTRRGVAYRGSISSPLTAESGCSRLSPHLAYGCLSLREVSQRVVAARSDAATAAWKRSLAAFHTRLAWHCHFIQKLERSPAIERAPIVRAMAQLERRFDERRFEAWRTGRTGWPLVDASMRYLQHHGWINFRMRAMLVSVATYSLSLPWQPVAEWLARLFVDYEPGIHYPQVQMQAGLSAQTVLRIYNPVLQAQDLDPEGHFVRRWVPELRDVSQAWIFEPWRMPPGLRAQAGWAAGGAYPAPLVDFAVAHRQAKAEITRIRGEGEPRAQDQMALF